MALQLRNWMRLLRNLGAGLFLCASVGCKTTGGDDGPELTQPINRSMEQSNQVRNHNGPGGSSNINNIAGQGTQRQQSKPNGNIQSAYNQQTAPPMRDVVVPTQSSQFGFPNDFHQANQQRMTPQQHALPQQRQPQPQVLNLQQQQPNPLPPLMPESGPSAPLLDDSFPMSSHDLKIPDSPPANAKELSNLNSSPPLTLPPSHPGAGPQILPAPESIPSLQKESGPKVLGEYTPGAKRTADSPAASGPSLTPANTPQQLPPIIDIDPSKEAGPKVLGDYNPGAKRTPPPTVITTPPIPQPPVEAPITVFPRD